MKVRKFDPVCSLGSRPTCQHRLSKTIGGGKMQCCECGEVFEITRTIPDTLMDGAVTVIHPRDLRNRVGQFLYGKGCNMGDKVDIGKVQDWIVEFVEAEKKCSR